MGNTSGPFVLSLCPASFLRNLTAAYCALLDRFRIDHTQMLCLDRQPFLQLHLVAHRGHSLSCYFYIVSSFFGLGSNFTENTVCPNITANDIRLSGLNLKCLLFELFSTDCTKNPQHKMSKQSVYWDPRCSTRKDKLILFS